MRYTRLSRVVQHLLTSAARSATQRTIDEQRKVNSSYIEKRVGFTNVYRTYHTAYHRYSQFNLFFNSFYNYAQVRIFFYKFQQFEWSYFICHQRQSHVFIAQFNSVRLLKMLIFLKKNFL